MQCTFNKWRYFLNEVDASYLQKLFHVIVSASISKERGGDITETQAEIRGIDGVTTLSVVEGSEREDAYNYYRRFSIKFELIKIGIFRIIFNNNSWRDIHSRGSHD